MLSSNSTPNSVSSLSCFVRLLMLTRNRVVSHGPHAAVISRRKDALLSRFYVWPSIRTAVFIKPGTWYILEHSGTFWNIKLI